MSRFREGQLVFRFGEDTTVQRFDSDSHGLSHCMKSVDFIVEAEGRVYYLEVKDPDDTGATTSARQSFKSRLTTQKLLTESLVPKYRDTFLYRYASGYDETPCYIVMIAMTEIDAALLLALGDGLRSRLPVRGPEGISWQRPLAAGAVVLNLAGWKKHLGQVAEISRQAL